MGGGNREGPPGPEHTQEDGQVLGSEGRWERKGGGLLAACLVPGLTGTQEARPAWCSIILSHRVDVATVSWGDGRGIRWGRGA